MPTLTSKTTEISGSANIKFTATGKLSDALREFDEALELKSQIPRDAYEAIKDFVHENIKDLFAKVQNLDSYEIPEIIAEWWHLVIEILQGIFM